MTYEQTVKELIKRGIEKPQEIMQEVVDHMRSVKIGKEYLGCSYAGNKPWNLGGNNSKDIRDYEYLFY